MPLHRFDHEKLDVYRLAIEYVAGTYQIAKSLTGNVRFAREQWLRAAQSVVLNIAEGNGKESWRDKCRFFEIARGSALECVSIQDVLLVCQAIDETRENMGREKLQRIVSMLTRLIHKTREIGK